MRTAATEISEAAKRFRAGIGDEPLFTPLNASGDFEQVHHGTTDAALAAWEYFRNLWRNNVIRAEGKPDYRVPDTDGSRTIVEPALILYSQNGQSLALTGVAWGYGGEGPHGGAAILADAGFFRDYETALKFLVGRPSMGSAWELKRE
jgi:hypothetical protein